MQYLYVIHLVTRTSSIPLNLSWWSKQRQIYPNAVKFVLDITGFWAKIADIHPNKNENNFIYTYCTDESKENTECVLK